MDVTNAVNVDSRRSNFEVLQNYGKRKMFLVCGSSGIIFKGYGITMMRIEIPSPICPTGMCTHARAHTLRDLLLYSYFEMLTDP